MCILHVYNIYNVHAYMNKRVTIYEPVDYNINDDELIQPVSRNVPSADSLSLTLVHKCSPIC